VARRPKNPEPQLRTITTSGHRNGAFRTDVDVRGFDFIIDEPEKLGGKNLAPTPMEYVTGALGGCFNVTIEMVARDQEFHLKDLDIYCEGIVDHRGLFGTADVTPHYQSARVDIYVATDEPEDRRPEFEQESLVRCPVYNLIKDAGAPIEVTWFYNKKREEAQPE